MCVCRRREEGRRRRRRKKKKKKEMRGEVCVGVQNVKKEIIIKER